MYRRVWDFLPGEECCCKVFEDSSHGRRPVVYCGALIRDNLYTTLCPLAATKLSQEAAFFLTPDLAGAAGVSSAGLPP